MQSEDGVCRLSTTCEAHSHIAPGTTVHCVRQRSDVNLVEKSACTEGGRQHLGHVTEERNRELRYVQDAQTRPVPTEALEAAEDAAATRSSTTLLVVDVAPRMR